MLETFKGIISGKNEGPFPEFANEAYKQGYSPCDTVDHVVADILRRLKELEK